MPKFSGRYQQIYMGKIVLSIEHRTVIPAERFILDTHTRYLLASDWFINLGIEWCLGVGKYQSNSDEKHLYRCVDATDRATFKEKFR